MFEKELYKKAIENSKIPVIITDFNGGILDVSLGFVKLSGIKKDVLIGMDVRKILGIPELKEKFEMIQKIKGGQFKIEIEKFSLEGMDFYILTLIKLNTGESSLSRMDFLKDVLESAFDVENLQKYLRLNIEYFVNIFGADGAVVLKKVTKPQEGFVMLHISKNAS
ncbi:MAG: PAS domain S-box protein, partial [Candidatus Hydrothermae bacterium]|nr:PAS domain S-box protein [Candidatus Hydrothermae bacterium]